MAGGTATAERTFSEAEKDALVRDAITRETASLTDKLAAIESENTELKAKLETHGTELQGRLDTLEAERDTLQAERDTVRGEFDAFKAELEQREAAAARSEARVAAVREAAAGLKDDFFTDERAARWAQLSDDDFEQVKAELAAVAGSLPQPPSGQVGDIPRETAMTGEAPKAATREHTDTPSATKQWLLGPVAPATK